MFVCEWVLYPGRSVYASSASLTIGVDPKEGVSATDYIFKNSSMVQNNSVKRNLEAVAPGAGSVPHGSLGLCSFPV